MTRRPVAGMAEAESVSVECRRVAVDVVRLSHGVAHRAE